MADLKEHEALVARIAALEQALQPFALAADRYGTSPIDSVTDTWQVNQHSGLTYGDLRQARAVLAGPERR